MLQERKIPFHLRNQDTDIPSSRSTVSVSNTEHERKERTKGREASGRESTDGRRKRKTEQGKEKGKAQKDDRASTSNIARERGEEGETMSEGRAIDVDQNKSFRLLRRAALQWLAEMDERVAQAIEDRQKATERRELRSSTGSLAVSQ